MAAMNKLPELRLRLADNTTLDLTTWRNRFVLVNFWATWCQPCRGELTAFSNIQNELPETVRILALSIDEKGWSAVTPFVRQLDLRLAVSLANKQVLKAFGLRGLSRLPHTLLYDRSGELVWEHRDALAEEDLRRILGQLK
jgi:thiol-disulfide isomerase/thioredoxin